MYLSIVDRDTLGISGVLKVPDYASAELYDGEINSRPHGIAGLEPVRLFQERVRLFASDRTEKLVRSLSGVAHMGQYVLVSDVTPSQIDRQSLQQASDSLFRSYYLRQMFAR